MTGGETNLNALLATTNPLLHEKKMVFCSVNSMPENLNVNECMACIQEHEGLTLILQKDLADRYCLQYESVFHQITLQVHSSLEAVGLTAAISTQLAKHSISANVVAGYYHDHVFVPCEKSQHAMTLLQQMQKDASNSKTKF